MLWRRRHNNRLGLGLELGGALGRELGERHLVLRGAAPLVLARVVQLPLLGRRLGRQQRLGLVLAVDGVVAVAHLRELLA